MATNALASLWPVGPWLFTALVFALIAWWVWKLRYSVRHYLRLIETVSVEMGLSAVEEDPKKYASRIRAMSDDELVREIESTRKFNSWGKQIAVAVEGLKASVPFLADR